MTNSYPRETDEPMEFTVRLDGAPVTTDVDVALAPEGVRPTAWGTPELIDGALHVRIKGLQPGTWTVYARPTGIPGRRPVINCGTFFIS